MTDEQYRKVINELLASGKGYAAIADLSKLLEIFSDNQMSVMREMKAEKRAMKKICVGSDSNKAKIKTILTLMGDDISV